MTASAQILRNLRGAWILHRDIQPDGARLFGEAVFTPVGEDALAYRETGVLTLADGQEFSAYRQYRYCLREGSVIVDFADGPEVGKQFLSLRFFQPDSWFEASDVHACGNDSYHATYKIFDAGAFETVITVRGPAKAYQLVSRYSRSLLVRRENHNE